MIATQRMFKITEAAANKLDV